MVSVSFELFPPKTVKGLRNFITLVQKLEQYRPAYFSVTFGAGATSQDKTLETVETLSKATKVPLVPHISCVHSTKESIDKLLSSYSRLGINKLLVLRGDFDSESSLGDFRYAVELLEYIRSKEVGFELKVAAYPETHPQSGNTKNDLHFLKQKVDAGASGIVTQYFYNFESFSRFYELCREYEIKAEITPGIMPIYDLQQIERFSNRCGADFPRWLAKDLLSFSDDKDAFIEHGVSVISSLCQKVIELGINNIHFYTLNRYYPVAKICDILRERCEN